MEPTVRPQVTRLGADDRHPVVDHVVAEAPFELRLGDTPIAVLMRTPGDETDLARGFALTEGIVLQPSEIAAISPLPGDDQGDRWVSGSAVRKNTARSVLRTSSRTCT